MIRVARWSWIGQRLLDMCFLVVLCAGLLKLFALQHFVAELRTWSLLPRPVIPLIALAVPASETFIGCSWLLRMWQSRLLPALVGLLIFFSLAYASQIAFGSPPDCACFGPIERYIESLSSGWAVLMRNAGILAVLAVASYLARQVPTRATRQTGGPSILATTPTIIVLCLLTVGGWAQPEPERPYAGLPLMLPSAITNRDLDAYSALLHLTDDQTLLAKSFLADYANKQRDLIDQQVASLRRTGTVLAESRDRQEERLITPSLAADYATLMIEREIVANSMLEFEEELFQTIEAILTDDQLPAMQRVRGSRTRDWSSSAAPLLPGAHFDLTRSIAGPSLVDLSPELRHQIETLVTGYELTVTPLHVRRLREAVEIQIETFELHAAWRFSRDGTRLTWGGAPAIAHEQDIVGRLSKLREKQVDLEARIRDVNRRFVSQIMPLLPPMTGRTLWRSFSGMTYPESLINKDPVELVLREFLDAGGVADDERIALENLYRRFSNITIGIETRMHRAYDDANIPIAVSNRAVAADLQTYREKLSELANDRHRAGRAIITELRAIVGQDRLERSRSYAAYAASTVEDD